MPESHKPVQQADTDAHDVLAAEAFAMPAPDPSLHHGPVLLPEDPTGIEEPHDVLAAEEFAMPAVPGHGPIAAPAERPASALKRSLPALTAGLVLVVVLLRLLRRR
jgi:hypothetical protein